MLYYEYICDRCGRRGDRRVDKFRENPGLIVCEFCIINAFGSNPPRCLITETRQAVPSKYEQASIEHYPHDIADILRKWPGTILHLGITGIPGSGKTYAAWAMQRACKASWYVQANELRSDWLVRIQTERDSEGIIAAAARKSALIIDDIESGSASPGWIDRLWHILDERTKWNRPTVITTTSTSRQLESEIGRSFVSRMRYFKWIKIGEVDRRVRS